MSVQLILMIVTPMLCVSIFLVALFVTATWDIVEMGTCRLIAVEIGYITVGVGNEKRLGQD